MNKKVSCSNISCKHHTADNGCSVKVNVGSNGVCESFEKGFLYYFGIVASAMKESNYIDIHGITDDLRIGLFYILKCYDLGFSECSWGEWRFIQIKDGEDGPPLHFAEIIEREINMEEYSKLYSDFMNGKLPSVAEREVRSRGEKLTLDTAGCRQQGILLSHRLEVMRRAPRAFARATDGVMSSLAGGTRKKGISVCSVISLPKSKVLPHSQFCRCWRVSCDTGEAAYKATEGIPVWILHG